MSAVNVRFPLASFVHFSSLRRSRYPVPPAGPSTTKTPGGAEAILGSLYLILHENSHDSFQFVKSILAPPVCGNVRYSNQSVQLNVVPGVILNVTGADISFRS